MNAKVNKHRCTHTATDVSNAPMSFNNFAFGTELVTEAIVWIEYS